MDVEQLPDGSLLVSDNQQHTVYRISYARPTACRVVGATVPHAALPVKGALGQCGVAAGGLAADLQLVGGRCSCHEFNLKLNRQLTHLACGLAFSCMPAAIASAPVGCAVNLGPSYVPGYRRCFRVDVSQGAGRYLQLATSLVVLKNKLVLSGAALLPSYTCSLGPSGWVGLGLPESQANTAKMVGAKVLFTLPAPGTPTGQGCTSGTPPQREHSSVLLAQVAALRALCCSCWGFPCLASQRWRLPHQKADVTCGASARQCTCTPPKDLSALLAVAAAAPSCRRRGLCPPAERHLHQPVQASHRPSSTRLDPQVSAA